MTDDTHTPAVTCACCGRAITDRACCIAQPGAPWGTPCREHEEDAL